MSDRNTAYSYVFKKKCPLCDQLSEEEHLSLYDCLRAISNRISVLEDEILAKKFNDFHLSSMPPTKGD